MRSSKRALACILALSALLSGCATAPQVKVVPLAPPAPLLQPCQEPENSVKTTRDMVTYLLDLRDALRGCAAQVEALRGWVSAQKP